jgi:hypothetical protein
MQCQLARTSIPLFSRDLTQLIQSPECIALKGRSILLLCLNVRGDSPILLHCGPVIPDLFIGTAQPPTRFGQSWRIGSDLGESAEKQYGGPVPFLRKGAVRLLKQP